MKGMAVWRYGVIDVWLDCFVLSSLMHRTFRDRIGIDVMPGKNISSEQAGHHPKQHDNDYIG